MQNSEQFGIFVQDWTELPNGKKAVLFDNARAFGAYCHLFEFYSCDNPDLIQVRARRIHPESIQWAQNFDVIAYVGLDYGTWKPFLHFPHYILPVHADWLR